MILSGEDARRLDGPDEEPLRLEWYSDDAHEDGRRIEDRVARISQGVWASGYFTGLEFQIWDMIHHPDEWDGPHPYCTEAQRRQWADDLKTLTVDQGRFIVYDIPGHEFDARFVTLDELATLLQER